MRDPTMWRAARTVGGKPQRRWLSGIAGIVALVPWPSAYNSVAVNING